MLDAALIEACADPSLKPAIVRQFVDAVGSVDPLSITVKSGERLILLPRPQSSTEAMELVRQYLGRASVRVGLTQYPAGIGIIHVGDQQPGIIEPCDNLKMGTTMFAKIMRIVSRSFDGPKDDRREARIFGAAVEAWRTGSFEGVPVFNAPDPGPDTERPQDPASSNSEASQSDSSDKNGEKTDEQDIGRAGIRIDLTRIGGQK